MPAPDPPAGLVPAGTRVGVLGRGRWASTVTAMLGRSGVDAVGLGSVRRRAGEGRAGYVDRVGAALEQGRCALVWLCVPPGEHVLAMVEAAAGRGVRVVAEKPWPYPAAAADAATARWEGAGPPVVVCFEFVLLDALAAWATLPDEGAGLTFHGAFAVEAPDRLGLPAAWNLGSHLVAVRERFVPRARVCTLRTAYDAAPERWVRLEDAAGRTVAEVDFLGTDEPLLQRLLAGAATGRGPAGELDHGFAARVARTLTALEPWEPPAGPAAQPPARS